MGKFLTSRSEDYSQWYNELVVKALQVVPNEDIARHLTKPL